MSDIQADNVIDNKKIILKDELLKILPKTGNASIAVGYFFISGLSAIIKPLQDVDKVRLLISNTTDKTTAEALIEGFHSIKDVCTEIDKKNFVNQDRKDKVKEDVKDNTKQSLERMEQTTDEKSVVELLIEMMKNGKIEVRVYPKEKLHAKAYIFQPKDTGFAQGMGIVGSSNLSLAGISHNSELNLKTYNAPDVKQLLDWFEELWNDGLEFTEDFDLILQNSWAGKTYSANDLFLKAAYTEYKEKIEGTYDVDPIWGTTFPKLFPFQKNAVDQGLTMFELYGGTIIGDVVGLGKTYVGTAIMKYLTKQDYRPLIICPPPLEPMWEKFCSDYEVDAKILSRGKLSQENFELFQDYRYKDRDLVLIDESHHFRNNNSRQYENLKAFMEINDAKGILLTATPYSNKPDDIKNQIMLFHQSEKTYIPPANETDLNAYFRAVKATPPTADLTDLLKNIMIRRTRRYVINQWGKIDENGRSYLQVGDENKYFPDRKMVTGRYDINKVYQRKYETIVSYISQENLTFGRYSLGNYLKEEYRDIELYKELGTAGTKLIGLIRTLLLKRMESSLQAFKVSIGNYINGHRIFLKALEEGKVPIGDVSYKLLSDIAINNPDEIDDIENFDEFLKKAEEAGETKYKPEAFDIEKLIIDIQNDIETFEKIDGLISRVTYKTDDKLIILQKLLNEDYAGKKVLVFSEFATTVKYLYDTLQWKGVKEKIDSTGNSVKCARLFDPENNPSNDEKPKKSEEISLLISTDVLAEGVNLQAGEVVINYDFHWNPTKLIQRAGRVDRIGSKNDYVIVHNFLLDPKMEEDFGLEVSVDNKIDNIQRIVGEDYQILKKEERINKEDIYAIYREENKILDKEEEDNPLEPSEIEIMLRNIMINDPKKWDEFKQIPDGIRSSGNLQSDGQLLLSCESGSERKGKVRKYYLIKSKNEIKDITSREALELLKSDDDAVYSTPENYDELLSFGWKKFVKETEQMKARSSNIRLSIAQKWIMEKLLHLASDNEFSNKRETIETLRKAFSIPILKGKLNRELNKIRKSDMPDSEIIDVLSGIYLAFDLQKQVNQEEEEKNTPRILYSKYVEK